MISPYGWREIGIGPHVYKIPIPKQIIPKIKMTKSVKYTKYKPDIVAIVSIV